MTSIKDAIKAFEASAECVAAEAEDVRLCPIALQLPLIAKMDGALGTLKACKHLRLSTNAIDKIANLNGLDNLEILSLGRNAIKSLNGIDPVAETLKQLWVSYNQIGSLAGVEKLQNLEVLFMSNNKLNAWAEVERLSHCPKLRDLLLKGNPLEATCNEAGDWRLQIIKRLPGLKVRARVYTARRRRRLGVGNSGRDGSAARACRGWRCGRSASLHLGARRSPRMARLRLSAQPPTPPPALPRRLWMASWWTMRSGRRRRSCELC